jgi:hypothetical protein
MGNIRAIALFVVTLQVSSFVVLGVILPRWLDRVDERCRQSRVAGTRPGPLLL